MTNQTPSPAVVAGRWLAGLAGAAAILVACLVVAGCGAWSVPDEPTSVIVGVDVDVTGRGVAFDRALRLAAEQVNERQLAGAGRQVELRVVDNRGDATLSAQNLATLAADPQVVAIVTAGCGSCVIDAAGSSTVPVIAVTGEEAVAAPAAERRWVFRLGPNAADDADLLAGAMDQAGVSSVAVIAADDPYGRDGARWFDQAAQREGMQVTVSVELPASATDGDLADVAATVLDAAPRSSTADEGPDAVLLWLYPPQAAQMGQALRESGYRGATWADMVAADELFAPGPLVGARVVATQTAVAAERIAASPAAATRQEWVLTYVARYGGYQLHATWAADALLVVADAIERADSTDRAQVRDRIESTRIDGISGPIRFTPGQHSGLLPGALVILTADADRWQ